MSICVFLPGKARPREGKQVPVVFLGGDGASSALGPHTPPSPPTPAWQSDVEHRATSAPQQDWVDSGGPLGLKLHLRIGLSVPLGHLCRTKHSGGR